MSGGASKPVLGGLAAGIGLVVLFAVMSSGPLGSGLNKSQYVEVVIPEGASNATEEVNFEPSFIIVFVGVNSTVRWTNHDITAHALSPDRVLEQGFFDTMHNNLLEPGESLEYTFTEPGMNGYHGEPGPWLRGTVLVLPEIDKKPYIDLAVVGLQDSYYTGEPVRFSVLVEGYGTGCGTLEVAMTEKNTGMSYSTGLVSDCPVDAPFHDLRLNLPVDHIGEEFSISVDQPGTYELLVTYKANITQVMGKASAQTVVLDKE